MESRLMKRVQRYGWDKAAIHYQSAWQQQLKPAQDLLLEMADIKPGEKVLDIACGTGLVSFKAAEKAKYVVGTDISERMIDLARNITKEKGIPNIQFERMDAEQLELPDESYDVVLCALGLMYVPDPFLALTEIKRVLKPGGRMVAAVWGERDRCGWSGIFEIVDKRVASEVCPMFFQLGTRNYLELMLNKTGFAEINAKRISAILSYQSDDEACGAAFEGGPVALAYFKFDPQIKADARLEYINSIAPYHHDAGYSVPGEFVVVSAHKV